MNPQLNPYTPIQHGYQAQQRPLRQIGYYSSGEHYVPMNRLNTHASLSSLANYSSSFAHDYNRFQIRSGPTIRLDHLRIFSSFRRDNEQIGLDNLNLLLAEEKVREAERRLKAHDDYSMKLERMLK
jgi:hypothetical protein